MEYNVSVGGVVMKKYNIVIVVVLVIFVAQLFACSAYQQEYYVSVSGDNSGCSGDCPITKPCTFDAALGYAQHDSLDNIIHVLPGQYNLTASGLEYTISDGHSLFIQGDETGGGVILDGADSQTPLTITTGNGVDDSSVLIMVENLTLTHGISNGLYVYIQDANLILKHNKFIEDGNESSWGGGANIFVAGGDVLIDNNIIRHNEATVGGGMFLDVREGNATVINNEFSDNFVHSAVKHDGGGLFIQTRNGKMRIIDNIFKDNNALDDGGGLFAKATETNGYLWIVNNTIVNNSAGHRGGGIYLVSYNDDARMELENNIIWDNTSVDSGQDVFIDNAGSSLGSLCSFNANLYDACTGIDVAQWSKFSSINDIYKNPRLTGWITLSDTKRSLRLIMGSPAIDVGAVLMFEPSNDYEGKPRRVGPYVNLGAVEEIVPILTPIYFLLQ